MQSRVKILQITRRSSFLISGKVRIFVTYYSFMTFLLRGQPRLETVMTIEEMKKKKQELGYSLKQLSELSGVPVSTINKIFNGYTSSPRYQTLQALSRVFESPAEETVVYKTHPAEDVLYESHPAKSLSYESYPTPGFLKEGSSAYAYREAAAPDPEASLSGIIPKGSFTLQDRERLPENRRTELIRGVLYDMASPKRIHQEIAGAVFVQLQKCISESASACRAYIAPLDVILGTDKKTVVQPDVFVLCHPEDGDYIYSAPEFVIEIVSPSTKIKDYLVKLALYAEERVLEYWIIDPDQKAVTVYHLSRLRKEEDPSPGKTVEVFDFSQKIPVEISRGKCRIDLSMI